MNSNTAEPRNPEVEQQSRVPSRLVAAGTLVAGRLAAVGALVACLLLLGAIEIARQIGFGPDQAPTFRLRHVFVPTEWLAGLMRSGVLQLATFALLGGLATWVLDRPGATKGQTLERRVLAALLGLGAAALLRRPALTIAGVVSSLILPLAGLLLGMWIAANCLRGRRAMLRAGLKAASAVLLISLAGGGVLYLATENKPLAFEPPKLTPTEKRQLTERIASAETTARGRTSLRLSAQDIDQLLAVAAEHFLVATKARVVLGPGTVGLDCSLPVRRSSPSGRYLNVQAVCGVAADSGGLRLKPVACQVGRLRIPALLLRPLAWLALGAIRADPDAAEMLASIEQLSVSSEQIELQYSSEGLRDDLVGALRDCIGEPGEVVEATAIYYRHLVAAAERLPPGDEGFITALRTAFSLAQKRSPHHDPMAENRAAILALAMLLGHPRIETAIGPVSDRQLRQAGSVYLERVRLRGRRDWVRHFFVSAGLTVLTNTAVSDAAGLLKEEIDAGEGGSGFSFADLLADRAGTQFARAATCDALAARRLQERLSGQFLIDDLFPSAAGLPEGLSETQLQQDYGGVGGPKYRMYLREIEARLAGCSALGLASR